MFNPQPKPEPRGRKKPKPLKRTPLPKSKKPLKRKAIKKKFPKKTGELELFKKIWEERSPFCEECEIPLTFEVANFSHRHSKGAHPELRLNEQNIDLLCLPHHNQWETGNRKEMKIFNNGRPRPI